MSTSSVNILRKSRGSGKLLRHEHVYVMLGDIGKYKFGLFIHRLILPGRI